MGGAALVLAFLVALAPGALTRLAGPAWGLDAIPWVPLALLPWLVIAGCPREPERGPTPASSVGLLLPSLGLALASDLAAGFDPHATLAVTAWGALLCALLAFAAQRGGRAHAAVWCLAVPAAALLLAARTFVGDLPADGSLATVLSASPLVWPLTTLDALEAGSSTGPRLPVGPLVVAALLVVVTGRGRSRQPESTP